MSDENFWHDRSTLESVRIGAREYKRGDRVTLRPLGKADIMDLALGGKTAIIEAIEQDFEDRIYLAVVVEDDPGQDIGWQRLPGHRFFFGVEEVEPSMSPRILIAGIGNIFLGDDAFGVEVARRLAKRPLPDGVQVIDFGIRGLDLTYALLDGHDAVILVDAVPRGGEPGTLYLLEPDAGQIDELAETNPIIDMHSLDPAAVLRLTRSLGGRVERILLVGCEPAPLEGDDMQSGLSEPVARAVEEAVRLIESLVLDFASSSVDLAHSPHGTPGGEGRGEGGETAWRQ